MFAKMSFQQMRKLMRFGMENTLAQELLRQPKVPMMKVVITVCQRFSISQIILVL